VGTKYKNKKTANTISLYMIGMTVAVITTIISVAAMASLVINDILLEDMALQVIPIVHFIAMFVGTFVAGSKSNGNVILDCTITSLIYFLTAIAITIFCFDGGFSNMFLGTAAIFLGATVGVLTSLKQKKSALRRKRRLRNC